MLFSALEFEHYFSSGVLQKGLSLFRKERIDLTQHPSRNDYHFYIDGHELRIKKAGQRFLEYECSCRKSSNCEHLAAALFYFYPNIGAELTRKRLKEPADQLKKRVKDEILFLKQRAGSVLTRSESKGAKKDFISTITSHVNHGEKNSRFIRQLALISEAGLLQEGAAKKNAQQTRQLLEKTKHALALRFKKARKEEMTLLYFALINSLRSNKALHGEGFYILGLHYISRCKDISILEGLAEMIKKRSYRQKFSDTINRLGVLSSAIGIRLQQLRKKEKVKIHGHPEWLIARAELLFTRDQPAKALKILVAHMESARKEYGEKFTCYLEFLLLKSRDTRDIRSEAAALEQKFLHEPFINEEELLRYLLLLEKLGEKNRSGQLIEHLSKRTPQYSFQKLSAVLFHNGRLQELISLIRLEGNQFKLLHKVCMLLIPQYDKSTLQLYTIQLFQALESSPFYQVQIKLLDVATEYLNQLPAEASTLLLEKIRVGLGHRSQLAKYLTGQSAAD